jgi:hypothetical protein
MGSDFILPVQSFLPARLLMDRDGFKFLMVYLSRVSFKLVHSLRDRNGFKVLMIYLSRVTFKLTH